MSLAALLAFFKTNSAVILGLLLVISEYLGTNTKLKSNSILQVIIFALQSMKSKAR